MKSREEIEKIIDKFKEQAEKETSLASLHQIFTDIRTLELFLLVLSD